MKAKFSMSKFMIFAENDDWYEILTFAKYEITMI